MRLRLFLKLSELWGGYLRKTKPKLEMLHRSRCVYEICCECGRFCVGETGRPLSVRLKVHKYNLKEGLRERSKLAAHAFEEGHKMAWDQAEMLDAECNSLCRKHKEAAHIMCCNNPISQASVEMSPLWLPLIRKELLWVGSWVLSFLDIYVGLVLFVPNRWRWGVYTGSGLL
jgi:hypothetical protein